jgi:hypothetical protein
MQLEDYRRQIKDTDQTTALVVPGPPTLVEGDAP